METSLALFLYSLVGAVATSAHYLVLLILVELLHFAPPLASAIGALVGAFLAYIGNRIYTFKSSAKHYQSLPRFFIVAAIGAMLNGAIVALGTEYFGFHYMVSQVIATLLVLLITFQFNKTWAFQA